MNNKRHHKQQTKQARDGASITSICVAVTSFRCNSVTLSCFTFVLVYNWPTLGLLCQHLIIFGGDDLHTAATTIFNITAAFITFEAFQS